MVQFNGTYKRTKCENLDAFLGKLGVNFMIRKAAAMASPTLTVIQNGDEWELKTASAMRTTVNKFKIGVEFEEDAPDGTKIKNMPTIDGENKLVIKQTVPDGSRKDVEIVREFQDDGIDVVMTCDGVVSKQFFKRH